MRQNHVENTFLATLRILTVTRPALLPSWKGAREQERDVRPDASERLFLWRYHL